MMEHCKLNRCDGSGMVDVYFLRTVTRHQNGSCFVKKEQVTRAQYEDLSKKVDWQDQTLVTAAAPCGCRS